jgi:hypothetical protein
VRLKEVEAERVHRPDVHLGETRDVTVLGGDDRQDPVLELSCSFVREGEGDDVPWLDTWLSEDAGDSLRDDLRLAGTRARDDLKGLVEAVDRGLL